MPADSATRIFRRLLDAVRSDNRDEAQNALREGYELVNAEGVAAWLELFDPEIEWSEGDEVPERHVYRGIRASCASRSGSGKRGRPSASTPWTMRLRPRAIG